MENRKKLSLRIIIVLPFIVMMTLAIGLITYLSFRSGQTAIDEVASQLRHEITARIQENLLAYLETPYLLIQLNEDAFKEGVINTHDLDRLEPYFWRLIQRFPTVGYLNLGLETGEYVGIKRLDNGELQIVTTDRVTKTDLHYYHTDSQGRKTALANTSPNFDSRTRPWYQAPVQADKPIWSEIYTYFDDPQIGIAAGQPAYDNQGHLMGVVSVDLILSQIDQYLTQLNVGQSGRTFIVERSGMLVGSSAGRTVILDDNEVKRVQAVDNEDPLIQETALFLQQYFEDLRHIKKAHNLSFEMAGARQFLQITPLNDGRGIDWLIIVVIPEADFMEQINQNYSKTLFLSLGVLVVASVAGLLLTQSLIQPLFRLNESAKALAKGEWHQKLSAIHRSDEIGELARSFQQMAEQLHEFVVNLENKVTERTEQLQRANEKLAQVNANKDKFFSILAHDLRGPFMPLLGNLDLLQQEAESLAPQEIMALSASNNRIAKRVFDLLDNLLQWAQLQMRRMEYQPERLNLADIAASNVTLLSDNAALKEIELHHEVDAALWVYADKHMLNTVIRNLTNNALKFTPRGGQVTIYADEFVDETNIPHRTFVEVSIVDTGVGMSSEIKQNLFKIDQSVTTIGTEKEKGTGLGLIICQEMVIRSGGRIWVESEVGKGTTIHFTVRLDKADE